MSTHGQKNAVLKCNKSNLYTHFFVVRQACLRMLFCHYIAVILGICFLQPKRQRQFECEDSDRKIGMYSGMKLHQLLITKKIGIMPNVDEPVRNRSEEFAVVSSGSTIFETLISNHWILVKLSSPIKSSGEIGVCFESLIHCFSKIGEIEMPLEIKIHRGGIARLYPLNGILWLRLE